MNAVGNRIKKLREDMNITQEAMAKVLDVTQSNYGRLEKDDRRLSVPKLLLIAKTLNTTVDYLLGGNIATEEVKEILISANGGKLEVKYFKS